MKKYLLIACLTAIIQSTAVDPHVILRTLQTIVLVMPQQPPIIQTQQPYPPMHRKPVRIIHRPQRRDPKVLRFSSTPIQRYHR